MTSTPKTLTIRDLSGLIAVIPTLVGFTVERSIVICCLRGPRVALTMRADLDGANVHPLATTAIMAASRVRATEVIAVGYIPRISQVIHEVLKDTALSIENQTMDDEQPIVVRALAAVGRDGWTELPMWGSEIPELRPLSELTEHPIHVERVVAGMAPAKSRAEIVARVQPGSDAPTDEFLGGWRTQIELMGGMAGHEMASTLDELLSAYEQQPEGELPDQHSMGAMAALVNEGVARDVASLRVSTETSHRWVDLWSAIARSTDDQAALAPLAVCGLASWVRGDGALANACVDQADAICDRVGAPRHPLVGIVRAVTSLCIPPEHWTSFAREVRESGVLTPTAVLDEQAS